jgi:ankyrin repeat protein
MAKQFPRTLLFGIVGGSFLFGLLVFSAIGFQLLRILDREEIHFAAQEGDVQKIKSVLEKHPERIEERDRLGLTPLHRTAWHNQTAALELLIQRGANVNALWDLVATGDGQWNALHIAANYGSFDAAKALIVGGTNINGKTLKGETPLDIAIRNDNRKIADLLKTNGGVSGRDSSIQMKKQ